MDSISGISVPAERPRKTFPTASIFLVVLGTLLITSCGGGGGSTGTGGGGGTTDSGSTDGGTNGGGSENTSINQVLEDFGIDTQATPRVDDDGSALPEDYSPLGATRAVNRFQEIQLFGVPLDNETGRMPSLDVNLAGTSNFSAKKLYDTPASTPWFDAPVFGAGAGDIDGDGLDETVVVWQNATDLPVQLSVQQEGASGSASEAQVVATSVPAARMAVTTGDYNGDGQTDVVVAISQTNGDVSLHWLTNTSGVLSLSGNTMTLPKSQYAYTWVSLASGNLDRDNSHELGVVVSEFGGNIGTQTGSSIREGAAYHWLIDDLNAGAATLQSGRVVVDSSAGPVTAKAADIAFGDVDNDNVDEVIIGGLDVIGDRTSSNGDPRYLLTVLDDSRESFATISSTVFAPDLPRSGGSGETQYLHYLFVAAGDFDGDGIAEILANQYVFDDLANNLALTQLVDDVKTAQQNTEVLVELDSQMFFADDQRSYYVSPTHMDVAVGAVAANDRDDIVIYKQRRTTQSRPQELIILGVSQSSGLKEYDTLRTDSAPAGDPWYPTILLPDLELNGDTAALRLSDGSYRYVLTEPIVLAALAAAPCSTELGQDLSSCRTGYGSRTITGGSSTDGISLYAQASVGIEAEGSIGPVVGKTELTASVRADARLYQTTAYRTEISILRETGPIEDTVIFTSIPYDIWSYEVLSHPQPELVGQVVEVKLPREPQVLMTTRDIYNNTTDAAALKVDEAVFTHTPGNPDSYPSAADKSNLLNRWPGIQSPSTRVGLNTGRQTVTIEQFDETTTGASYGFSASASLRVAAGVKGDIGPVSGEVLGFVELEIGAGIDADINTTRGEGTIFLGQVAEIAPDRPISDSYEFGLFAYFYDPPGNAPPFEVINYWVED